MPKAHVLDKVTVDLSQGHTQPAIQRLSSLVAVHPQDLDLRHRLAVVHRATGNRIEAGRWDYLTQDADADDVLAFERAYPDPVRRLSALRWQGPAKRAATEHARVRLETLVAAASAQGAPTGDYEELGDEPRWITVSFAIAIALGALGVLALAVLGVVTVAQWILP
ncbi:hypothetical protein F4553_004371 [Allocatelliglobosispora scoriae]|uniref:Tetratricopeptide repeat protein n=1 Tax=Allocatelliglobosispora scoriae TaxID=643052 RepID=A0A841BW51_9ACTN|nr:DUF6584 family protein [Allocatelliglobosispora scoriae]MBB5870992.1 hypothetical protein [Allocatelliglobosispora scoriae]